MKVSRHINIRRYNQIITVFAKNGFGLLLDQLGLFHYLSIRRKISKPDIAMQRSKLSTGERLRQSLEELGPSFIKLGQILSTRPDIFPADITEELKKLQDSVQPFPFEDVRALIEEELKEKLENVYKEFDEKPLAAASISQVHRARLNSGKTVAVKVQRPGIEKSISLDVNILKDLAHFLDNHTKYRKLYDFTTMANEFETTLKNELDFTREAENADTFKQNFAKDIGMAVPEINWMFTTKRILTMEYIKGVRVDDKTALSGAGIDSRMVAERLAMSIINQILRDGFFHADPHPGNIQVLNDGTVVLLDFGMVGRLSESRRRVISNFFIGVATRDGRMVVKSIIELDTASKRSNLKRFERDVDTIIDKYLTMPWDKIKIGELFREIFNIAFLHHIRIPSEFTMISKTLATLQGLMEILAPDLNSLAIAEPIARKMLQQSFSLKSLGNDAKRSFFNYRELFSELPSVMLNFLARMEDGDFVFQFEIKDIDKIQKRFERSLNRISFSMVLLSVSIIIAGIVIASGLNAGTGGEMYSFNMVALRLALAVAVIIILGLIVSLFRSSRM